MSDFGLNYSLLVYEPCMDTFAVPVTFIPFVSIPGGGAYTQRGIFSTETLNVLAENNAIYSDQRTILDIRNAEFGTLPRQGDHVVIPQDCNGEPQGEWVIVNSAANGGGETCLVLRKWEG